jgi:hypothetical protein
MVSSDPMRFFNSYLNPHFVGKMWEEWYKSPHPEEDRISEYLGDSWPYDTRFDEEKYTMSIYYNDPNDGKLIFSSDYYFVDFLKERITEELQKARDSILSELTNKPEGDLTPYSKGLLLQCDNIIHKIKDRSDLTPYPYILESTISLRKFIESTSHSLRGIKPNKRVKRKLTKKISCTLTGTPFNNAIDSMVDDLVDQEFIKKPGTAKTSFRLLLIGKKVKVPIQWIGTFEELKTFLAEMGKTQTIDIPYQGKYQQTVYAFTKDNEPIQVSQIQYADYTENEDRQEEIREALSPFSPNSTSQI